MSEKEDVSNKPIQSPIPLIYEHQETTIMKKDDVMSMLDVIERRVEIIRKRAFQIEEDRDAIFTTLYALKHSSCVEDLDYSDRQDIDRYLDRINDRCSTIEIAVKTVRDQPQEEALHKVNGIIDGLITELQHDLNSSRDRCLALMNSCTSYCEDGMEDKNFESALLCCTLDDQKRVRRRLEGLMAYIEKLRVTM